MPKLKEEIAAVDRPRERFLEKGPDALSKSDLLAILIGSGIKGKNVKKLSEQIIKKFGRLFLSISVEDLMDISGIGQTKALQIVAAIALVKRITEESLPDERVVLSTGDIVKLNSDIKDKKKEYLICLYLNARNVLIKKEVVSIGILDKNIVHPREVFGPALELRAASIALVHNHPSGDPSPSKNDVDVVNKMADAGRLLGVSLIDFIIIAGDKAYSFFEGMQNTAEKKTDYLCDGHVQYLSDLLGIKEGNAVSEIESFGGWELADVRD